MRFDHFYPLNFPQCTSFSTHLTLHPSKKIKSTKTDLCSLNILDMWPSIGAWLTYRGSTLRESWLSLSQTNSFSSWGGNSCPALLFLLRFGLAWACSDLLHDVRTTVSSYVQLPCCAQNIVFPCNHLFCLALKLFPPCFLRRFLSFRRRWLRIYAPFKAGCFTVFCFCILGSCRPLCQPPYTANRNLSNEGWEMY